MKVKKLWRGVAISILLAIGTAQESLSSEITGKYVFVPVYYVTDRIPETKNGVVSFKNEEQAITEYSSGIQYVPLAVRPDIIKSWDDLQGIGWLGSPSDPGADAMPREAFNDPKRYEADIRKLSKLESDAAVIKKVKGFNPSDDRSNSTRAEIVLYVHGFNNDFNTAVGTGAELSSWFKKPVFVYSWMTKSVSPVGLLESYRQSEVTYQHSQERYDAFMQALDGAFTAPNMVLVAHSMGNRLLEQWLLCRHGYYQTIPETSKYREVIMSNPDVDGKYFLSHIDRLCDETKYLRVFFSAKDRAIGFSKILHGEFYRIGTPNPSLLAQLRHSKVHLIDMTDLDRDFTDIVGHTMPCWLVASFHKYGSVGTGTTNYVEKHPYNDDELIILSKKK